MAGNNGSLSDFERLEQLNIWLDICIDNEDYEAVRDSFCFASTEISKLIEIFYSRSIHPINVTEKTSNWQKLIEVTQDKIPQVKYGDTLIELSDCHWFYLLYAKLLWAIIQQRAYDDSYTHLFDEIICYLERNLPKYNKEDDRSIRLCLMYLMQLSAISQGSESQGYSERARRVMNEAKLVDKKSIEFYKLWACYNIGVAYFHQRHYRRAVLEFNDIISKVKTWNNNDYHQYFNHHKGNELLLLPAIIYRAEVQLKLQMAYHALSTVTTLYNDAAINYVESEHQRLRVELIKVEAYQLLRRLDQSSNSLEIVYHALENKSKKLDKFGRRVRWNYRFPSIKVINKYRGLWRRYYDLLIEDHLNWLLLRGDDKKSKDKLDFRYLVKYKELSLKDDNVEYVKKVVKRIGYLPSLTKAYKELSLKDDNVEYTKEVVKRIGYLQRLTRAFDNYWKLVRYNSHNRQGYFQQISKYLEWLGRAAELGKLHSENRVLCDIAMDIYQNNRIGLLKDKSPKGIDLGSIDEEHYTWFTESMLQFFKSLNNCINDSTFKNDKRAFIKRLLTVQRSKNNLRIYDLELRYKYYSTEELYDRSRKSFGQSPCEVCSERMLCWRDINIDQIRNFDGLLKCVPRREQNFPVLYDVTSSDYQKIMEDWDNDFVRHLESPSYHEFLTKGNQFYFIGLQRWNSSSPAKGYSVGGGYLLFHLNRHKKVDLGIAIDPGFDYIRNLFHSGFSLDDIDIILISHAHVDHIRDFEAIIMLILELQKRKNREKRVHVILSLGTYKRLEYVFESASFRYFIEPYIIDIDREIDKGYFEHLGDSADSYIKFDFANDDDMGKRRNKFLKRNKAERFNAVLPGDKKAREGLFVQVIPTRAYHNDHLNYSDSFGFKIVLRNVSKDGNQEITFGYTGDTRWIYTGMPDPDPNHNGGVILNDISTQYTDCDALVTHLGSLIKKQNGNFSFDGYNQLKLMAKNQFPCEELIIEANHPYLIGMLRILSTLYSVTDKNNTTGVPLILVSEFGEELKGQIRGDFVKRLQKTYRDKLSILPVDVGTIVHLQSRNSKPNSNNNENNCNCQVYCVQCQKFVDIPDIEFEIYGTDHALYCMCRTCQKSIPLDVKQTTLNKLYEIGYTIETRSDDDNIGS